MRLSCDGNMVKINESFRLMAANRYTAKEPEYSQTYVHPLVPFIEHLLNRTCF